MTPGSGWCATSRREARAGLVIAASSRQEECGSPSSTMMTSGHRTSSIANCRPCWTLDANGPTPGMYWSTADHRILGGAPPPPPEQVMASLRYHNSVPSGASNVVVSSKLLSRVGPFDPGLKRTADWDMWLRLAREGPPAWVRRPLVANCIHSANMSRDMTVMFQELEVLARRHGIPVDRARHYRWAAWGARGEGRRWEALRYYGEAIAAGDLRSIGRAAIALLAPMGAGAGIEKTDAWTTDARTWIDELA